ncbi:MAG: carboxypeptidase regulatory-like domain-containing protein [Candidatus Fermentibacteria bacterium]|nr:carboxypeptidase regulatory-like domain-containing protein [Candidatus Fermentibacteria bacterium]
MSLHSDPVKGLLPVAALLLTAFPVLGHGARVIWEIQGDSVHISAAFDDGLPMDQAQVTVFSGAAPSVPYTSGLTDGNGEFTFLPDVELSLAWDVQVRKAGHGDIVHFSLDGSTDTVSDQGAFTTLQIILMSVCVVWGFIGTALFFASKRKGQNAHS